MKERLNIRIGSVSASPSHTTVILPKSEVHREKMLPAGAYTLLQFD